MSKPKAALNNEKKSKIKRSKFTDFLDLPIVLLAVVLFLALTLSPWHFIPDYFKLKEIDHLSFLGLVISSISSLLGIIVSIILIRFELLRQQIGRRVNDHFLNNRSFKRLITLLLITILWAGVTYISSKILATDTLVTQLYFAAILFGLCLIVLFPASYSILKSSTSIAVVRQELLKLNEEALGVFQKNKDIHFRQSYPLFDVDEDTSVDILKRLAQSYVKSNDTNAVKFILFASTEHLINWIGASKYREHINSQTKLTMGQRIAGDHAEREVTGAKIDIVSSIWQVIIMESIRERNIEVLNSLWNAFSMLHSHFATNKMYVLHLEKLDYFERQLFEQLMKADLPPVLEMGLKYRSDVFLLHLEKNCPDEKYIKDIGSILGEPYVHSEDHNIAENVEWGHVSGFHLIGYVVEHAIKTSDAGLIFDGFHTFHHLIHEVVRIRSIGKKQQAFVVIRLYETLAYYLLEAIKSNSSREFVSLTTAFDGSDVAEYVTANSIFSKRVVSKFSDFVIEVNQTKAKSAGLLAINDLGTLGRALKEHISKDNKAKSVTLFILDTFKYLKTKFEDDIENYSEQYIDLERQVRSIMDWKGKADHEVDQYCGKILKTFKKKLLKSTPKSQFIEWRN
ncbi:MAG: hypothetical protein MUC81_02520 [Bacteroidia bacterium]|jgi:hypothetical protein|nr:hypothetical protein [Bacteroidia bacterium]